MLAWIMNRRLDWLHLKLVYCSVHYYFWFIELLSLLSYWVIDPLTLPTYIVIELMKSEWVEKKTQKNQKSKESESKSQRVKEQKHDRTWRQPPFSADWAGGSSSPLCPVLVISPPHQPALISPRLIWLRLLSVMCKVCYKRVDISMMVVLCVNDIVSIGCDRKRSEL